MRRGADVRPRRPPRPSLPPRPARAQVWALIGTFVPAAGAAALAFGAAGRAEDSFGYGLIGLFAAATAPAVAVLGQLTTAVLGAIWPSARTRPFWLGSLGAFLGWTVLAVVVIVETGRPW
jgi:hypothetical protein